jgi:hypothetical protein
MALSAAESGRAIEQASAQLLRIWRLARAAARRAPFPGLLDGITGDFFARSGRLLAEGGSPEDLWGGLAGVVRWPPRLPGEEFAAEWALVQEVLAAACRSFGAEPAAEDWLARALAAAVKGTSALRRPAPSSPRPEGVLVVLLFGEPGRVRRAV